MTNSIDLLKENAHNAVISMFKQDDTLIGECERYEYNEGGDAAVDDCRDPFIVALLEHILTAPNPQELIDIFTSALTDAEGFSAVKAVTSETFFCEDDFLETVPLLASCPASFCDFTCDDLSDAQLAFISENYNSILAELESCDISSFEYCDVISPGYKSGYGLSVAVILLSWGFKKLT